MLHIAGIVAARQLPHTHTLKGPYEYVFAAVGNRARHKGGDFLSAREPEELTSREYAIDQ